MKEFPTLGEFKEKKIGSLSMFIPEGFSDHNLVAKVREQKIEDGLTELAENRSGNCVVNGCKKKPSLWVRDIRFYIDEDPILSTAGLDGPIPGLCLSHEAEGTDALVRWAFDSDPAMSFGILPDRWEVSYTEGSVKSGIIVGRNALVKDEYNRDTDNSEASAK